MANEFTIFESKRWAGDIYPVILVSSATGNHGYTLEVFVISSLFNSIEKRTFDIPEETIKADLETFSSEKAIREFGKDLGLAVYLEEVNKQFVKDAVKLDKYSIKEISEGTSSTLWRLKILGKSIEKLQEIKNLTTCTSLKDFLNIILSAHIGPMNT